LKPWKRQEEEEEEEEDEREDEEEIEDEKLKRWMQITAAVAVCRNTA